MVRRYPHVATIKFNREGTYDANRKFTEGEAVELSITCNIQPAGFGTYVKKDDGTKLSVDYKLNSPLFADDVPEGAKIRLYGKEYLIKRVFKYQLHAEIWV